ncbi:hypothetical protein EVAR_87844_1 [Eumeta japonica]|uniref:DUF5641 domain-containing protein n=1 Tax=Eumeta variegata TaxID=151549 RepID=A0A4C1YH60_EUMVA|nr:hypothetical protein EVAR_87844_1 [Eumeta japonica]
MPSAEGDLPPEHLYHHQPTFTCTGVDYFGPTTVTIGRKHEKRCEALFTCLTTCAVRTELAKSLSSNLTSKDIASGCFIARRGTTRVKYSDNVPRRARGNPTCRAPAEGDIVLIVDPSSPRFSWSRGKIKKTYPDPDNQVRVVDVEMTEEFCGVPLRRS